MHELWQAFQTASFGSCNEMSGLVSNRPAGKEAQTPRSAVGRCRRGFSLCESVTPVAGDIVRQELGNVLPLRLLSTSVSGACSGEALRAAE
jgi:hypothetical protein